MRIVRSFPIQGYGREMGEELLFYATVARIPFLDDRLMAAVLAHFLQGCVEIRDNLLVPLQATTHCHVPCHRGQLDTGHLKLRHFIAQVFMQLLDDGALVADDKIYAPVKHIE